MTTTGIIPIERPESGPSRLRTVALVAMLLAAGVTGCASVRTTDPPRTATEQFLLSNAARDAVAQLDFSGLHGRLVYVDATYFAASEQPFVLGELRAALLMAGARMAVDREKAEIVLEVRSGGVGVDRKDFLLGIPALALAAGQDSGVAIPFATPEIAILKNTDQLGVASVAFIAYWVGTGEVVAVSGPYIGRSYRDDWWFFGYGPQSVGDIPPIEAEDP